MLFYGVASWKAAKEKGRYENSFRAEAEDKSMARSFSGYGFKVKERHELSCYS